MNPHNIFQEQTKWNTRFSSASKEYGLQQGGSVCYVGSSNSSTATETKRKECTTIYKLPFLGVWIKVFILLQF